MTRVKLVVLVVGIGLFAVGCMEWQLKTVAKDSPQTISATQLAMNGPGDNANIILTNFELCDDFVYQTSGRRTQTWKKVWVPAVPLGQACGGNVQIIVTDNSCRNEADVAAMDTPTLRGMVVNKISSLGSEEKKLLSQSYPGIDFNRCWIVQNGRTAWNPGTVILCMGLGGFIFLGGLSSIAAGLQNR